MSAMIAPALPTDDLLTRAEAAQFLRSSVSTLERHALNGTGPAFIKLGPGRRAPVVYRRSALVAWLSQYEFRSTSEYGK